MAKKGAKRRISTLNRKSSIGNSQLNHPPPVQAQDCGGGFQHGQNKSLRKPWIRIQGKTLVFEAKKRNSVDFSKNLVIFFKISLDSNIGNVGK